MSNKTLTLGQAAAWCGGQIAPELEERPFAAQILILA